MKTQPRLSRPEEALPSPADALALALSACRGRRAIRSFEIYLEEEERLTIEVKDGEVESLISARTLGLALRVMSKGGLGFSFANNLLPGSVLATVDRALAAAQLMPKDPFARLARPSGTPWPQLAIADPRLSLVPQAEKIELARRLEAAARGFDPRVTRVRSAEYDELHGRVWLANSEGVSAQGETTLFSASVEAVAEAGGEAQAAAELETVHFYDKLDVARIGQDAARKAVMMLSARGIESGRRPVVFSAETAAELIAVLGPAVGGDAVDKQRSWLRGRRGKKIGSAAVTLVDDGLLAEGPGSFPFDDEGTASRRTPVVREGILENFLYNTYYGVKAGCGSTGNGLRPSFHLPPEVDTSNWVLLPGAKSWEQLVGEVGSGILIAELMGMHTADPVTGEFSLGANGFRVRRGRVAEPVRGMAIAGTMKDVLARVAAVGDRIKFTADAGAPAILIEEMDISGSE